MLYNESDILKALKYLKFPMILKLTDGYSSIGIYDNSRLTNEEELRNMYKKLT